MKTYSAKKEIRIMGISMLVVGLLNVATIVPGFIAKYPDAIYYLNSTISIFLGAYGLMHVFNLNRFK